MESNNTLPTVTEHFIKFYKEHGFKEDGEYPTQEELDQFINDPYFIESMKCFHEYAILFAKHHRKEMTDAIKIRVTSDYFGGHGIDEIENSIENAYGEDIIK